MDPAVTGNDVKETRMLAAIVFTDVVGFSRLASQNEARVFVALQRDMAVMTSLCRSHSGQVLNTMGDGMLLCFMSAVDAMTCAVEIQRTLFNQAKSLPPSEVLHHRIGVHLGDIIMSGDNVFGDGVNIAARLQGVAKPDSICFSHTVYEVVKNKLKLNSKYVGNQQLKNLGEPIKIWMIAPLEEPRPIDFDSMPSAASEVNHGASGWRSVVMVALSILLLGGVFFAFKSMKMPTPAALKGKSKAAGRSDDESSVVTRPQKETPTAARTEMEIVRELSQHRAEFNFQRMIEVIETGGANVPAIEKSKLTMYRDLANLMAYLGEQAAKTSPANKIRFALPSGEQDELFTMGNQLQVVGPAGNPTPTNWAQLGPLRVVAIARSLSEFQVGRTSPAPANIAAWTDLLERELTSAQPGSVEVNPAPGGNAQGEQVPTTAGQTSSGG